MALDVSQSPAPPPPQRCPIDHAALSQQKTIRVNEDGEPAIAQDAAGVWHVRGYEHARTILRATATKQAGFSAELTNRLEPQPILYQEGKPHHDQRRQTARFFTPKAVSDNYRQLMERYADQMIRVLQRRKQMDLSVLAMKLAVRVAGEVIGLTNSRLPGMDRRINALLSGSDRLTTNKLVRYFNIVRSRLPMLSFFYADVQPAIEARKQQPKEDIISHLLAQKYKAFAILIECVTYAAAGMITTREFITITAWHMLEQPTLRARYLQADEAERHAILHELLRLEPVIAHLLRRATSDITLTENNATITIPTGDLIDLHITAANVDQAIVGEDAHLICPARPIHTDRAHAALLSFGDGAHRCPGAYIAIQETDIFLQRLLALPTLRIVQKPSVSWIDVIQGYELRNFVIAVD